MLEGRKKSGPRATETARKDIELSGLKGVEVLADGTIAGGAALAYVLTIVSDDKTQYEITSGCAKELFDKNKAEMAAIVSSFTLKK